MLARRRSGPGDHAPGMNHGQRIALKSVQALLFWFLAAVAIGWFIESRAGHGGVVAVVGIWGLCTVGCLIQLVLLWSAPKREAGPETERHGAQAAQDVPGIDPRRELQRPSPEPPPREA